MSEVKWIKIVTDIFDDEKIKLIETLPDADAILVIWFKILCLAGRSNKSGLLMMNDKIYYTDEMLASLFNRPLNTVRLGLKTFNEFGMIELINNSYYVANWEKHQNVETLDKVREQTRLRVEKYRQNLILNDCNVTGNATVTECNAIEERIENKNKNKNKNKDIENLEDKSSTVLVDNSYIPYEDIVNLYNDKCGSKLPSVKYLSQDRKKAIKTAWNRMEGNKDEKLETFKSLFTMANNNAFLTGNNDRSWRADFNWLLKEKSMVKVLEDGYAPGSGKKKESTFNNFEHRPYDGREGSMTMNELEMKLLGWDQEASGDE